MLQEIGKIGIVQYSPGTSRSPSIRVGKVVPVETKLEGIRRFVTVKKLEQGL